MKSDKADFADDSNLIELYKFAWQTRNFEISLFWQRSNYFLVLNSALAAGFLTQVTGALGHSVVPVILAAFGLVCSLLWIRVNAGSKYWQTRWEHRLVVLERRLKLTSCPRLFDAPKLTLILDAARGLGYRRHRGLRRRWDRCVMTKPSVSTTMVLLSVVFGVFWDLFLGYGIYRLVCKS